MAKRGDVDPAASAAARALMRKRWDKATPEDRAAQAARIGPAQAARRAKLAERESRDPERSE